MTTYGTIPPSSSPINNVNRAYISRAKERLKAGLGTRRPWRQMFDLQSISLPISLRDAAARVGTNSAYFLMNYAIIVLLIIFLSLLWHPISLIAFIAMTAVWLFLYFLRDEPVVFCGRLISDRSVLLSLSCLTIVALLQTRAATNTLVSLAVGVVVVLIHAAVRKTDDLLFDDEEVPEVC